MAEVVLHQNADGTALSGTTPIAVANVRASEGAGTTTLTNDDNRWQVFNLSAARTCVLPTTDVVAGDVWMIDNRGAFDLTIQASGGQALTRANSINVDATIRSGNVTLVALQAAPTTAAHWRVLDLCEEYTHTTTFTFTGGAVTGSKSVSCMRRMRMATVHLPNTIQASGAGNTGNPNTTTSLPTRFAAASTHHTYALVRDNGSIASGEIQVSTGVQILKAPNNVFTGGAGATGLENGVAASYVTG